MCGCVRTGDANRQHSHTCWRWVPSGGFAFRTPDGLELAYAIRIGTQWHWQAGDNEGVADTQLQAIAQAEIHGGEYWREAFFPAMKSDPMEIERSARWRRRRVPGHRIRRPEGSAAHGHCFTERLHLRHQHADAVLFSPDQSPGHRRHHIAADRGKRRGS